MENCCNYILILCTFTTVPPLTFNIYMIHMEHKFIPTMLKVINMGNKLFFLIKLSD